MTSTGHADDVRPRDGGHRPSVTASNPAPMEGDVPEMTPEQALELARQGGSILCLDVPKGTEFGIDLRSYAVGERFQGIKMIPARGVHFVTCGGELERFGVFLVFGRAEVCVMSWDAADETLKLAPPSDQRERYVAGVHRMEFDSSLGPYPLATERQWRSLSAYVSEAVLARANVPVGTLVVPGGIDDESDAALEQLQPYHSGVARVPTFVQLDPRKGGASGGCAVVWCGRSRGGRVRGGRERTRENPFCCTTR